MKNLFISHMSADSTVNLRVLGYTTPYIDNHSPNPIYWGVAQTSLGIIFIDVIRYNMII